jgi:hypothetical protein
MHLKVLSNNYSVDLTTTRELITKYQGYRSASQFGQYFTFTTTNLDYKPINTRLYTTIFSMRPENIQLMEKLFPVFGRGLR